MVMKRAVLWIIFLVVLPGFASTQTLGFTAPPKLDSNYVRSTWDSWSARVFTTLKTNRFSIRSKETNTYMRYAPSKKLAIGVGIAYKFILLDVGFGLPVSGPKTQHFDVQLAFRLRNHLVDVGYWRYKGFEAHDNHGGSYEFREDVRSQTFGFNYYHDFNSNKVPLRDQMNGTLVQTRSAGTFGIGGYWFWNQLKADRSLIPENLEEYFSEEARVDFSSQFSIGVLAGYAYSLVLPRNFFLLGAVLPGIGINVGNIQAGETYNPPILPNAKINLRAAIGYVSQSKIYVIVSGDVDSIISNWGNTNRYSYLVGKLKLVVGYRFTSEIGFLEKTAKRLQQVQFH